MRELRDDLMPECSEEECYEKFCICCGDYIEKPKYDRFLGGPFCDDCMKNEKNCAELEIIYPWAYRVYPVEDRSVMECLEKKLLIEDRFCDDEEEKYEILLFVNT